VLRVSRQCAKDEVQLLEKGKRKAVGGMVEKHGEPRVQTARIDRRQDTHTCQASKECHLACGSRARGCVDCRLLPTARYGVGEIE
jgi:hypothetical protein